MDVSAVKVDIIIPIYNAFEELIRCIGSIEKWTDLEKYRLILINDNSTDERVSKFLDSFRKENVVVVHNRENRGFSANINMGMEQSDSHDVILLNSDTVVTCNWVEKLVVCAYSADMIATVTPLSNNATLCSVPDFCEENKVPEGYTVDEYAKLIENVSMRLYPEIPVANGFCMYVKRKVIEDIGNFDAETFGRGYGEENDFCYRAIEAGYHHVMCDDTFILHTGTSSFVSEEKQRYIEEHEKILDERYPELMQAVRMHCRDNPNAVVSENIRFWSDYKKITRRKTIMYLIQSDFKEDAADNVGGTQLHVRDLTHGLRNKYDVLVAARNDVYLNLTLYAEKQEFFFKYYIGEAEEFERFRSEKFAELYRRIIDTFQVGCVHIHHTKGLSLELYYEAVKKSIPVFATMHDYYYVCPNVKLLDENNVLCIGNEKDGHCRKCLKLQRRVAETVPYISIWRKENLKALQLAREIFVPSESAKRIVSEYFTELAPKIRVIEHGSDFQELQESHKKTEKDFRVAFIGGISVAKGYQYAAELIKKGNRGIHWYLFGTFEKYDGAVERKHNFTNTGAYDRKDLPQLIKEYAIDLVCILPIWPETFCYTISEAVLCGVPVLVTDIGALGDRVRKMDCGWVVAHQASANEILDKINEIKANKEEYQQKQEHVRAMKIRNINQMCEIYAGIYEENICGQQLHWSKSQETAEWLLSGVMNAKGRWLVLNENAREVEYHLKEVQGKLLQIENSITYRLLRKIQKVNIPGKHRMKIWATEIYRSIRKRK